MNLFPKILRKIATAVFALSLGGLALALLPAIAGPSIDVVGTAHAKSDKGNGGNGNGGNSGGNGNSGGGNGKGGGNNGNGNGNGGSSASPSGDASGAAADPGAAAPGGAAGTPSRNLRIVHRNGISETIRAGRYEMRDARGRVIVNRLATQRDLARLSRSIDRRP